MGNIVLPIGLDGKRVNKDYVMSIVKSIGMEDRLTATPSMLSGGQKQRVAMRKGNRLKAGDYSRG